jgi:hypothetical protein
LIPNAYLQAWRASAPWPDARQVEQDLIICRVLCDLSALGITTYPFAVENGWYRGDAEIASFAPGEMFGTKLRAVLQRNKNRDLFDLLHGLERLKGVGNRARINHGDSAQVR